MRLGPVSTIMDVGCGSGGSLDVLAEFGRVIGVEPSETLARRARARGVAETVHQQDALQLDVCREVDLFTMFDVLEHIEDDRDFLARLRRQAGRPHRLLVSVPACPFLFSEHDRILHHHRRYSRGMLAAALTESGYEVRRMSHFLCFLFPLALLVRMKEKLRAKLGKTDNEVDVGDVPPALALPFSASLRLEAWLGERIRFPIGVWLFALAERRE